MLTRYKVNKSIIISIVILEILEVNVDTIIKLVIIKLYITNDIKIRKLIDIDIIKRLKLKLQFTYLK